MRMRSARSEFERKASALYTPTSLAPCLRRSSLMAAGATAITLMRFLVLVGAPYLGRGRARLVGLLDQS